MQAFEGSLADITNLQRECCMMSVSGGIIHTAHTDVSALASPSNIACLLIEN